jgi:hypothetical protein
MKQRATDKSEAKNERENSEEFKRSGRTLEDFEARCDTADDIIFLGVDPDAPF